MKLRRTLAEPDEPIELNLIPLIDVIMFLLIFFISTTSFIEEAGVKVDKPQASNASGGDKGSIVLEVTNDGKVKYEGKEIGMAGVRSTVKRLCAEEPMPVVIQADQKSLSGLLIKVIDEAKMGGAKDVSVAQGRTASLGRGQPSCSV